MTKTIVEAKRGKAIAKIKKDKYGLMLEYQKNSYATANVIQVNEDLLDVIHMVITKLDLKSLKEKGK